jgi:N-succinyldiaminopimelate aminotransferase
MPNPFYQIYEGAALLAGAEPYCVNAVAERGYAHAWHEVPDAVWARTQTSLRVFARQSNWARHHGGRVAAAVRALRSSWVS